MVPASLRSRVFIALAALAVTCLAPARPAMAGEVLDLPIADGVTQRVLYLAPAHPRGLMVMLPGGSGEVGIVSDGSLRHADNFVIRSRQYWLAAGFALAILDAPTSHSLRGERSSAAYAALLGKVLKALRQRSDVPLWLLGTSQGAIGAMNGAAHAPPGSLAGVILSEPVSILGGSHETVFDAGPGLVRVPALVVVNQADRCPVAPPAQAPAIIAAMRHAPRADLLRLDGGRVGDKPCGSLSAHGYAGIEAQVVQRIIDWTESAGSAKSRQPSAAGAARASVIHTG